MRRRWPPRPSAPACHRAAATWRSCPVRPRRRRARSRLLPWSTFILSTFAPVVAYPQPVLAVFGSGEREAGQLERTEEHLLAAVEVFDEQAGAVAADVQRHPHGGELVDEVGEHAAIGRSVHQPSFTAYYCQNQC